MPINFALVGVANDIYIWIGAGVVLISMAGIIYLIKKNNDIAQTKLHVAQIKSNQAVIKTEEWTTVVRESRLKVKRFRSICGEKVLEIKDIEIARDDLIESKDYLKMVKVSKELRLAQADQALDQINYKLSKVDNALNKIDFNLNLVDKDSTLLENQKDNIKAVLFRNKESLNNSKEVILKDQELFSKAKLNLESKINNINVDQKFVDNKIVSAQSKLDILKVEAAEANTSLVTVEENLVKAEVNQVIANNEIKLTNIEKNKTEELFLDNTNPGFWARFCKYVVELFC